MYQNLTALQPKYFSNYFKYSVRKSGKNYEIKIPLENRSFIIKMNEKKNNNY